ncbi:alpha-2-macroglobulin family protein [Mucilaginibacter xinganensis]|uniref:MG2 domain-containing protein n=1 Tax=Mucilaginibacter xinganensis TaxID=1234841 RepID=A0A223P323_9SPHI|nr:alpha-2-macroglobulin family protein [Mucilaginibacter xinganensis]ASU36523.1 MG2 domain-containing protein [Mucilaginibacter xinganensis]
MTILPFKTLKYLSVVCFVVCFTAVNAQVKYERLGFRIDSLANVGLPKSALKEVDRLDAMARADKNAPQQIRAVIYRMTFQSYLEEDALVAIISRLKADIAQAKFPVQPVLQSLLAETYWKYYQQNRYKFNQRSRLLQADTDFTKWDLQTIIAETGNLYGLSLADAKREQDTPLAMLNGVLDGDTSTRYLRPTLYDLLVQRALDFYLTDEPGLTRPKLPFLLNDPALFGDSRGFINLTINTTDTASTWYQGIKYLQQATAFHLQANQQEALADIDLQRLKFLYSKASVPNKDSLYLAALDKTAKTFADNPISSEALVLQGTYYKEQDSLKTAYNYFKKAEGAYPESLGGKNAAALIENIKAKEISAKVEEVNIPNKPILALLTYRNLTSAGIAIYRLSEDQLKKYNTLSTTPDVNYADITKRKFNFLRTLKPTKTDEINWADAGDYRTHSFEFKIAALAPGNYVLIARDKASNDESLTEMTEFKISALAFNLRANPDGTDEVRVMERETGKPLSGVQINLTGRTYTYNATLKKSEWNETSESGTSNKEGQYLAKKITSNNNVSISLQIKGDTLRNDNKRFEGANEPDNYDDPEDKTILFTDRQIYRPGQTIYFKGLQIQTFKGKSKIITDKELNVDFKDVNDKTVSSLKLKTNEFGTVTGSFIIPQAMLNGDVELETEYGSISVKVEEYKRPTFQVTFLPVKESYKINDTVAVKGTVMAFSGYGLSQAKVAYHITRSQNRIFDNYNYSGRNRYNYNPVIAEIKTDTLITDNQGNYTIKFRAIAGESPGRGTEIYNYNLSADVTDASGETHSAQTMVTVGNNDIIIVNDLPFQLLTKGPIKMGVKINNLNGQPQKGVVTVEVYPLQNIDHPFNKRLWEKPDQHIMSKTDFENDFPFYAYANEDEVAKWPRLARIANYSLKINADTAGIIDMGELRKQQPGTYRVIISAHNEKGDTTLVTKYVNLVGAEAKPASFNNWVIPVVNAVKPGEKAEFFVGVNEKINVLMERYNAARLISSKWITIDKGQQNIKIPIADTDKNVAVQFMMIYQNRLYSSYQKIFISDPDQNLKISFLTFRNKLQPGEKEQWKLRITNGANEKQAAELLAELYDASLNDIAPAQNWTAKLDQQENYQPNYFAWNSYDFLNAAETYPLMSSNRYFTPLTRDYERLNLFGYSYYGGYNNGYSEYLQKAKKNAVNAVNDKRLEAEYLQNAVKVKSGYVVSGRIKDAKDGLALPGVIVAIKGFNIATTTNTYGYFKIKVPVNGKLAFSFLGYLPKELATTKSENVTVKLEADKNSLNEVVVMGYGTQKRSVSFSASVVSIRGNSSGYLNTELAGVAAGVQVMADSSMAVAADKETLRELSIPKPGSAKPITIRKNFNETAFFYPQLLTNEKGEILVEFTIPESLTKWRFKALAHTKQLQTGYIENEVVTQKQLNISANMPRFFREGDTIEVSARLANLTEKTLKGTVKMQLFNGLSMQPVNLFANQTDAAQQFEIAGSTNKAVTFRLAIPAGLDALTYRLTADAGQFTDGEENTLPVLPNRMLVTESMPMMVRAGQTRNFTFDRLVNQTSTTLQNKTLTLEYTQNPAWYAVQALPYMMEFPYECSEQTFSRYYANSLAASLVNRLPAIKQVFNQWKSTNSTELLSNLEKNQELKATLLEETPWLQDAANESEQKKRIALLFDLNKMSDELQTNLDKLQKMQLPDGGFPWFGGDRSDRFITQHILQGIGELEHLNSNNDKNLEAIANNALKYADEHLIVTDKQQNKNKGYATRQLDAIEIQAWFTRSYFLNKPVSNAMQKLLNDYLTRASDQWTHQNVYEQGMIALTMQRYKKANITMQITRSILETAQQSNDLGMYWAKNQRGYYWYQDPVATQSLMIELFTEAGNNTKAVDEMKIWLLRNKQTNNWKTTTATAAACYALLLKENDLLAANGASVIKLDGKALDELKPAIKADAGTGYLKTNWVDEQVKPALGNVEIKNNSTNISWGALHWQYLENLDKITSAQTNIQLERKYFIQKQTGAGTVLIAIDAAHKPKTGDLLKVVVNLKADRDFEYVQLKDLRPSGTEPLEALSAYKYQDGLYYYQVTKDVSTNFFISYLAKGSYVFEYQLRVAQPGDFSTGITTVQSVYAPEFNAHSNGGRITIKP